MARIIIPRAEYSFPDASMHIDVVCTAESEMPSGALELATLAERIDTLRADRFVQPLLDRHEILSRVMTGRTDEGSRPTCGDYYACRMFPTMDEAVPAYDGYALLTPQYDHAVTVEEIALRRGLSYLQIVGGIGSLLKPLIRDALARSATPTPDMPLVVVSEFPSIQGRNAMGHIGLEWSPGGAFYGTVGDAIQGLAFLSDSLRPNS